MDTRSSATAVATFAVNDDLNALGRRAEALAWFVNNVRIRLVSLFISFLMLALLVAGIAGTVITFASVSDIGTVWSRFDTGLARRLVLLSGLREHLGFGGLIQHVQDYVLKHDPLLRQAITQDIARLREIAPAYLTGGASDEERRALATVLALVDDYDRTIPLVAEAISRGEPPLAALERARIAEAPALAALARLKESLSADHIKSADRIEDALWTVSATVGAVMLLSGVLLLLLGFFFFWFTRYRIVRSLDALRRVMVALADGDKSVAVPLVGKADEIGDMARTVEVFKANIIRADDLEARRRADAATVIERAKHRETLTSDFGAAATRMLTVVRQSVEQVGTTARDLFDLADASGRRSQAVAGAAEQASANVGAVASAAEELEASGREISHSVGVSAGITREAVSGIQSLDQTMVSLNRAADQIGEIISLIGKIAGQTNLLALNASIEAQRAGAAGKGFAVVASEVKSLAAQTGHATQEIADQVHAIQEATRAATEALKGVSSVILRTDQVVATIASAVEQQNAATGEIGRNIDEAARSNAEVAESVSEASRAADRTGGMASRMLEVIEALNKEADTMTRQVEEFLIAVQAS